MGKRRHRKRDTDDATASMGDAEDGTGDMPQRGGGPAAGAAVSTRRGRLESADTDDGVVDLDANSEEENPAAEARPAQAVDTVVVGTRHPSYYQHISVLPSKLSGQLELPERVTIILDKLGIGLVDREGKLVMIERYSHILRFSSKDDVSLIEFGPLARIAGVLKLGIGADFLNGTRHPPRMGLKQHLEIAAAAVGAIPNIHYPNIKVLPTGLSRSLNLPPSVSLTLDECDLIVTGARMVYHIPYTDILRMGHEPEPALVGIELGPLAAHPGALHFFLGKERRKEFCHGLWKAMTSPRERRPRRYTFREADAAEGVGHYYDGVSVMPSRLSTAIRLKGRVSVRLGRTSLHIRNDRGRYEAPYEAITQHVINAEGQLSSLEFGPEALIPGVLHLGFDKGGIEFHGLVAEARRRSGV